MFGIVNKIYSIFVVLTNEKVRSKFLAARGFYKKMDDASYLKKMYKLHTSRTLKLDPPITFNEKIQWMKIYDRDPKYTVMSDKLLAKDFVGKKIGFEYIVPNIRIWNNPDEINLDELPKKFVLKCNHNSGKGMCICEDKDKINFNRVKSEVKKGFAQDYYSVNREWSYKNINRKIFAEKYMESEDSNKLINGFSTQGLIDYKFYCFNGDPKFLYVGFANIKNGIKDDLLTYLSLDWTVAPFYRNDHKQMPILPPKPKCFDQLVKFSKMLSEDIPFVRVDFYVVNEKPFFSEFTFYPGAGYGIFEPEEWEEKLGGFIVLDR